MTPEAAANWTPTRLSWVAETIVPQRDKPTDLTGDVPWVRIEDFNGKYISESHSGQGVNYDQIRSMPLRVFPPKTVVTSCSCTMGATAITTRPLITNQTFIGLVPDESRLSADFLYYLMQAKSDELQALATGAIQQYLSQDDFRSMRFALPPVSIQRRIADYLDRETAEIDAMAIELDQAMVLIDERFQAEVERCFNSLDAPHMPLRSQIQSMTTGTSVTAAKFAPAAGEPGVLATSAVFGHELDEAAVKSVDPHEYARLTCPLRVNTLLVSRMNTMNLVGKAVTVDRHLPDVYLPDRLWAVEVEVPRYVYWWTRSQSYREQIRGLAVGASDSMKTLSQQAFRGITLPVPPVPQQDAVAAQLDESAELTGALKSELQEAKVVLEERRAALISAAVTGQIDVTAQGVSAAEQLRDELEVHV